MTVVNCSCDALYPRETLATLRTRMLRRMGFSAQAANPPPGKAAELNDYLQEAQRLCYADYAAFRTLRWFTWQMVIGERFYDFEDNNEARQVPTPVNDTPTTATTGGSFVAGTYYARVSAINANGETLASTEISAVVPAGTSTNTVTWKWITPTLPIGVSAVTGYKIYRSSTTGTELYVATVGLVNQYVDTGSITPAGALPTENTTSECSKLLTAEKIKWVGVERDGRWYELKRGISPEMYSSALGTGFPARYDLRGCLEIWPAPAATDNLRIFGNFGVLPFALDADYTTIDPDVVWLRAMTNAKAARGDQDAGNYHAQEEALVMNYVAASHRRYIPRDMDRDALIQLFPPILVNGFIP